MTNNLLEHLLSVHPTNNFEAWVLLFATAAIFSSIIKFLFWAISKRLRKIATKTETIWDDVALDLVDGLKLPVIFFWLFYFLTKSLNKSELTHKTMLAAVICLTIFQIALWGHHLIRNWRDTFLNKKIQQDPSSSPALGLLYKAIQTAFISTVVLIGLSNLGIDIGALLAGLGVGGIAVALAAQNILGDLLASLSIVLDKPFVVGDFIVTGDDKGTVENIGIKTTRLRSLSGEELVLSNKQLLESRIHNYKRMWRRRVVQQFGVLYSTPADTLEQIPLWVKNLVQQNKNLEFDRCHFQQYGSSSLDFELVFFVLDPDYNVFMDYQHKLLIDIFRKFNAEGVGFAFPTQSIYIEKMPAQ